MSFVDRQAVAPTGVEALMQRFGIVLFTVCGFACARPPPPEEPEYQGQSYREALLVICKVDELAGLQATDDPLEKSQAREDWLNERVKNPDAIYFRTMLKVESSDQKSASLRDEAKKAGLGGCPLADTIAEEQL